MDGCELAAVGLGRCEQVVYEALIAADTRSAAELRVELDLPSETVEASLSVLQRHGLAAPSPHDPQRYTAGLPRIALAVLIQEHELALQRARRKAEELSTVFRGARPDRAEDLVETVYGQQNIRRQLDSLQRLARREVRAIDMPPYVMDIAANTAVQAELLGEGIAYRSLYDPSGLDVFHDLAGDMRTSVELGEQARVMPGLPMKLFIADDQLAMIPARLPSPHTIDAAIVVHPCGLLDTVAALFETLWTHALPLSLWREGEDADGRLTVEERQLVAMLATGLSDKAVARKLGVSESTFYRRMQDLTARLGAATRFQAGLQAAFRGWVANPHLTGEGTLSEPSGTS